MEAKEILIHRLRDFDAVFRSKNKINLLKYVIIRQFIKLFGVDEKKWINMIKKNSLKFLGYNFLTRPKTIDFLFCSRFYEPEFTKFILNKKGKIFLDIGAHIGRFSLLASKNFERVISFEPHSENFAQLKKNILSNKLENIIPLNLAISNKIKYLYMSNLNVNTGASQIKEKGDKKVKCLTLDSIIKKEKIKIHEIDLIKIDVENHEMNVLKGAKKLLKEGKPILIIESFISNFEKVKKILNKFGFVKTKTFDFYNHVFEKINETKIH